MRQLLSKALQLVKSVLIYMWSIEPIKGGWVMSALLQPLLSASGNCSHMNGARLIHPGEFTQRKIGTSLENENHKSQVMKPSILNFNAFTDFGQTAQQASNRLTYCSCESPRSFLKDVQHAGRRFNAQTLCWIRKCLKKQFSKTRIQKSLFCFVSSRSAVCLITSCSAQNDNQAQTFKSILDI